tara:strand:+ start:1831 stop:2517 length:687 start_codon:yes stop_codon:yes gene_type:complete
MDPLTEIGIKHNTDKATFHNFTIFYEQYFRTRRYDEMTILEIGIANGNSLLTLQEYFPNATIHAIDIKKESVKDYGPRIHTYLCSQDDESGLKDLFSEMEFDIIIDDGSHLTLHQLKSLSILFENVKSGGLYVCEDLHTSLIRSYVNSETIPLRLFENYDGKIPEIDPKRNEYINDTLQDIKVYKRDVNGYKCYRCASINEKRSETCENCQADLSTNNPSYTSILFKK